MIAQEIRELDETDKVLLQYKLERPSRTLIELGELVGLTWRQVATRVSRETYRKALYDYQKSAIDLVMDAKTKAIRKIIKLIDSDHPPTALKASIAIACDVLPKIRFEHSGSVEVRREMTETEINKLIQDILHDAGINGGAEAAVAELITKTNPR